MSELEVEASARRATEQLATKMRKIYTAATAQRSTGFVVPVVDGDPAADDPTNMWMFADGRVRYRTPDGSVRDLADSAFLGIPTLAADPSASSGINAWLNGGTLQLRVRAANGTVVAFNPVTAGSSTDSPSRPTGASSAVAKPSDASPSRFRKVYGPQWARSFCSRHGVETGGTLYYGDLGSGAHGERKIMVGFDDAQIRSDLVGATIREVEIKVQNEHAWSNSGITIHFGSHTKGSPPGSYSANRKDVYSGHWPKSGYGGGGDDYHEMSSTWVGRAFRDGDIKGLTVDQPGGKTSYGAIDWSTMRLAISGTK